jgi:hypothetical protein
MKRFFDSIALVIGAIWAMRTDEEMQQYEYDNGEVE